MLISTKRLSYVSKGLLACVLGCWMVACVASTPKQENMGEYTENTVLTAKVKQALLSEPSIKSLDINVKSYKNRVQLSGFVESARQEQKAVQVAKSVEGVQQVEDNLSIK